MRCTEEFKPVFKVWCCQNTWQSFLVLGEEILLLRVGLQNRNMTSYRVEIGEEAERRGAVDPERQEVLQLGMSLWLEGSTRQRQGAQEWVDLALGEGTYSRDDHIWVNTSLLQLFPLSPVRIYIFDTFVDLERDPLSAEATKAAHPYTHTGMKTEPDIKTHSRS